MNTKHAYDIVNLRAEKNFYHKPHLHANGRIRRKKNKIKSILCITAKQSRAIHIRRFLFCSEQAQICISPKSSFRIGRHGIICEEKTAGMRRTAATYLS